MLILIEIMGNIPIEFYSCGKGFFFVGFPIDNINVASNFKIKRPENVVKGSIMEQS